MKNTKLRIIAGTFRSRLIDMPDLKITRPTSERMREANFNKLQFTIQGKIFLDLFAGSGANPIEAVSRGAMKAIAVEKNKATYRILENNIKNLGINNIDAYNTDAISFLKLKKGIKVDIIYLDPPFKEVDLLNQVLEIIAQNDLLNPNGQLLIETEASANIIVPDNFIEVDSRRYANDKIMRFFHLNN